MINTVPNGAKNIGNSVKICTSTHHDHYSVQGLRVTAPAIASEAAREYRGQQTSFLLLHSVNLTLLPVHLILRITSSVTTFALIICHSLILKTDLFHKSFPEFPPQSFLLPDCLDGSWTCSCYRQISKMKHFLWWNVFDDTLVWRKSIHLWRTYPWKNDVLHFHSQWPWPFDLKFAPLLTLVQRCVSTKLEVSTTFLFRYKKPSCRCDSRPYCLTTDYLIINDCC